MAHQVATQSSRPEEPQCYNCGGMGHWAVACPEPTRETPAGLAAWRTASATRPGSGRAQHSDGRKSKGPIITKYGPPPPGVGYGAQYQPPPTYPPPLPSYPPPPPQPSSYPPQYHYPPGHGQPPPPPPPNHGQHHYPPPSYPPPPESYPTQHPRPSYPRPTQEYGTSTGVPQSYVAHPYPGQDNPQFAAPRPAYSGTYAQGSANGQKHHPQRSKPPHRTSASSPPKPQAPKVASSPPKPTAASPPAPITHALPPKPPKSVHEIAPGRDQRNNKRKHEHQNRPQDIKEHHPGRHHGSPKAMPVIHNNHGQSVVNGQHQQGSQNRQGKQGGNRRRSSAGNHGSNQPPMLRQQSKDSPNQRTPSAQRSPHTNAEGRRRSSNGEQFHGHANHGKAGVGIRRESQTAKAAEKPPALLQNIPSLPPKPATVVEAFVSKHPDERAIPAIPESSKLSERNVDSINGHRDRDNDDRSSTARHGTKSESSVQDDAEHDGRPPKRFRRSSRDQSRSISRHRDVDDLPPLDRRRSRSLQRRSSPSRSPRSRTSSVSSRSSDLNSLEAELLGVSARRPSTDSEARRRPERIAPPKAKRRKPTNSAFSRRW